MYAMLQNIPRAVANLNGIIIAGAYIIDLQKTTPDGLRTPLIHLLVNNTKWGWFTECQRVSDKIKQILTSNFLHTQYDPSLTEGVASDASNYVVGELISYPFQCI